MIYLYGNPSSYQIATFLSSDGQTVEIGAQK